ncbi:MAG: molybdopterin-dependent oxidoreductase [Nitrospiraceae bacterium]|nr:molybdopterin-dependent oxidoreductase [Nitrospiraceae bacterium]
MIEFTIDGKRIQCAPETTVLQAALANGIHIPNLCWDRRLTPYGGCRLCLVEVEGREELVPSCNEPVREGMAVRTETPRVEKARKTVLELLLVHHPLDCPVCDKAGECDLQDLAFKYGPSQSRFKAERNHEPEFLAAPLIERNTNRCILCGKCVRICQEHQGVGAINLLGRGIKTKVSPAFEETLDCEFCGQCVDVCPVGALGAKPYRYRSRVWFMDEQENVCPYCSVGCSTVLSLREGRIIRARGKDGVGINKGDLCPKGRFGFDFIECNHRLSTPLLRKEGKLEPASWQEALEFTAARLEEIKAKHGPGAVGALGSERCSVEDNYMLRKFMSLAVGSDNIDSRARFGYYKQVGALEKVFGITRLALDLNAPLAADVLFVLESDLAATHPVYGLKVLAARRDSGAALIVAGPQETKLSRWSTSWLRNRPATGVALVNGIMSAILEQGVHDKGAPAVRGFDQLREHLKKYSPEEAARISGISAEDIRRTAGALAAAKNPMLFASFGSSENTKGESTAIALMDLALLLGRGPEALGLPPEFANTLGLQMALEGNNALEGDNGPKGLDARQMLYGDRIKALYIMGENPAVTFPDRSKVMKSLEGLELIIVQDIMMTETAKLAHVVLPASSWSEKEGTFVGMTGNPQRFAKCLPENGMAIPDWKILRNLGNLMRADMGAGNFDDLAAETAKKMESGRQVPGAAEAAFPAFVPVDQSMGETAGDDYRLILAIGNLMQHSGSLTTISKNLDSAVADAYLQINPADAAASGVTNECFAKVSGKNGAVIFLRVKVTGEVPEGMVFAAAHFAHDEVNLLTRPPSNGEAPTVAVKVEAA